MKSFKEYLMENYRALGLHPTAKQITKSDVNRRYGHNLLDAMVDHMGEESDGIMDSDNIAGVYQCSVSNLRGMWVDEPRDKFQIAGWCENGKVNIIIHLKNGIADVILDYDNNFLKKITKFKINKIQPPDNTIVIADFSVKKQHLQYIMVKKEK